MHVTTSVPHNQSTGILDLIGIKTRLISYLESLRFPWLLLTTFCLFIVNVFIPDVVPFIDEILLALIAVVLSRLKRKPITRT
jgi:hypothetical protein